MKLWQYSQKCCTVRTWSVASRKVHGKCWSRSSARHMDSWKIFKVGLDPCAAVYSGISESISCTTETSGCNRIGRMSPRDVNALPSDRSKSTTDTGVHQIGAWGCPSSHLRGIAERNSCLRGRSCGHCIGFSMPYRPSLRSDTSMIPTGGSGMNSMFGDVMKYLSSLVCATDSASCQSRWAICR